MWSQVETLSSEMFIDEWTGFPLGGGAPGCCARQSGSATRAVSKIRFTNFRFR